MAARKFLIFQQIETQIYRAFGVTGRDIHRVLQTIQMKLILFCIWADRAILGSAKTALKFKYEILIGLQMYNLIWDMV